MLQLFVPLLIGASAARFSSSELESLVEGLLPSSGPEAHALEAQPVPPTLMFNFNALPLPVEDSICAAHVNRFVSCADGFDRECLSELGAYWRISPDNLFISRHLELGSIKLRPDLAPSNLRELILDVACHPHVEAVSTDVPLQLHGSFLRNGGVHQFSKPVKPNDAFFSRQWHMQDLKIPDAWETSKGDKQVMIMVIDTGIDSSHNDIKDNMWTNNRVTQNDKHGLNAANSQNDSEDDDGHGTHCAGTIGAMTNNKQGIAGINWKPQMVACKMIEGGSGSVNNAVKCMDYAVEKGVKIVSASWGGDQSIPSLEKGIKKLGQNNILFVTASGNNGRDIDKQPSYPASYTDMDNMVVVTGYKKEGDLLDDANYGTKSVHLGAPGDYIYSLVLDNNYNYYGGTSTATPIVAGILGLCLSKNQNLKPQDLIKKLEQSISRTNQLSGKTKWGGKPDASKLVKSC